MVDYAFPNISFKENVSTPIPTQQKWRNRIGFAGVFRRGPSGAINITSKKVFNYLYGNDSSPGAVTARQLFSLGVSDMVISRATPEPTPASATISLANTLPTQEAQIGYEGQILQYHDGTPILTTGMKLDMTYIGSPLQNNKNIVGKFVVKPTSRLNPDLTINGTSSLNYTVEDRLTSSSDLVVTVDISGTSNAYATVAAVTYTLGQTGLTLSDLNTNLVAAPNATLVPVASGDTIIFANGVELLVTGTSVSVVTPGEVAIGELGYQVKTLSVTNSKVRLGAGSRIYQNNALVAYVLTTTSATSRATTIKVAKLSAESITINTVLKAQALIGDGVVTIAASPANKYQYIKIDRTVDANQDLIANITPGRLLRSRSTGVVFTDGFVTVMGNPKVDLLDENLLVILVKGTVTGASTTAPVALLDPQENVYVFSTQYVSAEGNALVSAANPTAIYQQSEYLVESRQTLIDSYIIVPEAYTVNAFKHELLFKTPAGAIVVVDSGLVFDLPQIETSGQIAFLIGATYAVPVLKTSVAIGDAAPNGVAFDKGTRSSEILFRLKTEITQNATANALFKEPQVSSVLRPSSMYLETAFRGAEANRIYMKVTRTTFGEDVGTGTYSNDLLLNTDDIDQSLVNWTSEMRTEGGSTGSQTAFRDLYSIDSDPLVRIVALSDGAYGNKIKVSVALNTFGQFNLFVVDEDSTSYQQTATSEVITLSTRDVDATTGLFNSSANSNLVRVYYLPVINSKSSLTEQELNKLPLRIAPSFGDRIAVLDSAPAGRSSAALPIYARSYQGPNYLQNIYLTGGVDAASSNDIVTAEILRKAITSLEEVDIDILMAAGVTAGDGRYTSVIEEMVGQVNRASTVNGLRRALIQAPRGLSSTQAEIFAASLNSPRVHLIGGFATVQGYTGQNNIPVSAFYAATLALSSPEISPASISDALPITGIISVDTPSTPDYLDKVTRAGVEVLYYDAGLQTYKWLNGRTTSKNTFDKYASIRRIADTIQHDLYRNLSYIRSSKNDTSLRSRAANSVDTYLRTLQREGKISSFRATVCDSSNNTGETVAAGKLIISLFYTPVFPADYIEVSPFREIADQLSFQV